ncbi:MAG: hypothetical protein WBA74_24800 [Cyclobacteriaceae bacterium]
MTNYSLYQLIGISCLLLFVSCQGSQEKSVDIDTFEFNTTDATELYFKNMRESYYELEEKEGMKIYRLEDYEELDSFYIRPMIIYHWRMDKAYLMLEFDSLIDTENIVLSDSTGNRTYSPGQMRDYLRIAYDIEKVLAADADPKIKIGNRDLPVFRTEKEKSYFSLVLYDFFRFTNTY